VDTIWLTLPRRDAFDSDAVRTILQTIAPNQTFPFAGDAVDHTTVAILGTRYADFAVEEAILGPHGVRVVGGAGASADTLVSEARDAAVILAGSRPRFDAAVIERLACRGVVRYGVGVESVDLDAAARAGMWVAYVPDYGTDAVAVHAVTLLLATGRRLIEADATVKGGAWGIGDLRPMHAPRSITVGIVGLGRIGRRVAELLEPFGFDLLGHDPYADEEVGRGLRTTTLDDLLANSDAITLHLPGRSDGRPLLGADELGHLKAGAIVVNTARGSLIDESALVDGLRRGTPGFAALDVFAHEPPGDVFADVTERVILTPHMAWYTEESELDLRSKAAREALRIIEGQAPVNAAATPAGAR
jgi:D-3-phosphoglycerate dehydrogenase / 2-oxoglutarate reductase